MANSSEIILELLDVDGALITDEVRVELRNLRLGSLNQHFHFKLTGKRVKLKPVPATPNGAAEMSIIPARYRFKAIFIDVPSGEPLTVRQRLFVDPEKAKPVFPAFSRLPAPVKRLLVDSKWKAQDWDDLSPEQKGGLMNVCAKSASVELEAGKTVADGFQRLLKVLPARSYIVVAPELQKQILERPKIFKAENGALHTFPDGWKRVPQDESFKTLDRQGNLQVTFARDTSGEGKWMADVDLDDHSGVQHAFDVIQHRLTGQDTHPYNIHQILKQFQGIDPGYRLV